MEIPGGYSMSDVGRVMSRVKSMVPDELEII